MTGIVITRHAFERARDRLGWQGSETALSALLRSYIARREYPIPASGEWSITIPQENIVAVLRGRCVMTIYPASEAA